jgi:general secretion pathway protein L
MAWSMPLVKSIRKWIELLARLSLAWHDGRRAPLAITARFQEGEIAIWLTPLRHRRLKAEVAPSTNERPSPIAVAAGDRVPEHVLDAAKHGFVSLEFPVEQVVSRHITVPFQARAFLDGIVSNQIERLSPWPLEEVVHGYRCEPQGESGTPLAVAVLVAQRSRIEIACTALARAGLQVDRVVADEPRQQGSDQPSEVVTLWSRAVEHSRTRLQPIERLIGSAIAACFVLSSGLSLWALISATSLNEESEELAARADTILRQANTARSPAWLAALPPLERAAIVKEGSGSSTIVIEALSRALPDNATLTELQIRGTSLRIVGFASDPPSLLALLEKSGHLKSVHFSAPTTRGSTPERFQFHIEAAITPRFQIAED